MYFPLYVDLKDKKVLIVGGGSVALHKLRKLKPFEAKITVASLDFLPEFYSEEEIILLETAYSDELLEDCEMVIAATDNHELNGQIADSCRKKRIPVNSVDDRENCSFIFPSLITRGLLCVGISTSGASPSLAAELKSDIESVIPDNIEAVLDFLNEKRSEVKALLSPDKAKSFYHRLVTDIMYSCPPYDECYRCLLDEYGVKNR